MAGIVLSGNSLDNNHLTNGNNKTNIINKKSRAKCKYYLQKATELQDNEQYDESILYYNKFLEVYPNDYIVIQNKAFSLFKQKLFLEAIECYDVLIELKPEKSEGYNNKASMLTQLKRYNEASDCYSESIRLNPFDSLVVNNQGYNHFLRGKYKKSIAYYIQAIKLNPNESVSYTNLASSYRMLNQYDKMIEISTESSLLFPQKVNPFYHLATAYFYTQDYDNAIENCEKLASNATKNDYQSVINANLIKGKSLMKLNKFSEAISAFEVMEEKYCERNDGESDRSRYLTISFWVKSIKDFFVTSSEDQPLFISYSAKSL